MYKLKLTKIAVAMVAIPIALFCFDINETLALVLSAITDLFLGCWAISVMADENDKYFDH